MTAILPGHARPRRETTTNLEAEPARCPDDHACRGLRPRRPDDHILLPHDKDVDALDRVELVDVCRRWAGLLP
ncbi:hypothetical protein LEP48_15735 [Isoptericola sp. NEAU-Y5]|uniref:Uncharacterized protein n=1 Tax=Isoptericola luteus TaxID=2879484 RepID=A0ABS7ZID8_9MICO|nr:hypothetical protein [Isoptericola sp. NEAU-Y5]MCA5894791.1 hypothetical protein [Isoptericola sp. NEAU-Y5]